MHRDLFTSSTTMAMALTISVCITLGSTAGMTHPAQTAEADIDYSSCQATGLSSPQAADAPTTAELRLSFQRAWPFATGSGVRVAVIDTGVVKHPRLGEVIDGGDYSNGSGAFIDCEAHGTIVASLIGARRSNDWVAGIAPDSSLISVRHTAANIGDLRSLAHSMDAARDAGARIINISLAACVKEGSIPDGAAEITAAVHRAEEADVVVIAAAGNRSGTCPAESTAWPAVLPEVVAVSAAAENDSGQPIPADYAITGPWVDISAPGGPVIGVNPREGHEFADRYLTANGDAQLIQGTSFAAPLVSGTAALIAQQHPEFSAAQIRQHLKSTATPVSPTLGLGAGVVSPFNAVTWHFDTPHNNSSPTPHIAGPVPEPKPAHFPLRRLTALLTFGVVIATLALLIRLGR